MHQLPSFQDVELFVRDFAGLRRKHQIAPETRLEAHLGITGDDGDELLQRASKHFGVALAHPIHGYRDTFALADNEYLFHGEGLDLLGISALLGWLRNGERPRVRDLTMAELHGAIVRSIHGSAPPNTSLERARER